MNLSLDEIAAEVDGSLEGNGSLTVGGYSIDSRSIRAGELFFAIQGPRFDGHDFVLAAAGRGAVAAVVSESEVCRAAGLPSVTVASTSRALQDLARAVRRRWGHTIVAVTGSVGKTTTKEMIAALLGEKFRVLRSVGNMNNEYGLPLCLLTAEPEHEIAVLEMGMSAAGEIRKLTAIAEPNEGVITNVGPAHLAFFESVDAIADAKAELLEGLSGHRRAYLNHDDTRVQAMGRKFDGEIVTYGMRSTAMFRATGVRHLGLEGTAFTVQHERETFDFVLPLLGAHNVSNALAAISVARVHEVDWEDLQRGAEALAPERMRGVVVQFQEGFAVIDDCYNSSPNGLVQMIRTLAEMPGFERRILVAGEMLELGGDGPELHADCGREAVTAGVDLIVGVGRNAGPLVEGARTAGAGADRLFLVERALEAGEFLVRTLRKGDLVLMKASRGVGLEQALETLRRAFPGQES